MQEVSRNKIGANSISVNKRHIKELPREACQGFWLRKYGHQEELRAVVISLRREVWKAHRGLSGFSIVAVFSQLLVLSAEGQKLSTQKQHSGSRHQNESLAHSCSGLRKQADVNLNRGKEALEHPTGTCFPLQPPQALLLSSLPLHF